jgi:hypothetical protein
LVFPIQATYKWWRARARVCVCVSSISCRPITAEARIRSWFRSNEFCGGQIGTGTGFSPNTSVFCSQYHSASAPHSSTSTDAFARRTSLEDWEPFKKQCSFGNRRALDIKMQMQPGYIRRVAWKEPGTDRSKPVGVNRTFFIFQDPNYVSIICYTHLSLGSI